ncbi:polysaccharide deacetylase family protein [Paraburkholderia sp. RL17-337-BIB-A]|uniref:polysaccharide deacetylase family protein n=1 Tax=Paraburkholderia sp. RL17-337-BIB-A TaxID=3031636 RepID=UPI0038BCDA5A
MNETVFFTRGPAGKRASVSVTFDNLGEACDISMGRWSTADPVGDHYTATRVLPRLLAELDGLSVTYFIEAVNAELYPAELKALRDAGHEIGLHAWRHENWGRLTSDEQRSNLATSVAALRSIGVDPTGFRPPGGAIDADSLALLHESGFTYCSPVSGDRQIRLQQGMVVLPFAWQHVDAYLIDPDLAEFRASNGDHRTPASADEWEQTLNHAFDEAVSAGQHLTVIFHPYLFGADERLWQVLSRFLHRVRARDDVWLASCREVAEWTRPLLSGTSALTSVAPPA